MPHETIQSPRLTKGPDGDQYEGARVGVHWGRDQNSVQLSIESLWSDSSVEPTTTIFSDIFTREEINKLIRTLRKARDQAFGRDE